MRPVLLAVLTLAACRAPASTVDEVEPTMVTTRRAGSGTEVMQAAEPAAVSPRPGIEAQLASGGPPVYPELSRRLQEEGTVELRFEVLQSGAVQSLSVARSSGHARLDDAALAAARTWRFNPRTGGESVEVFLHRVVFRLVDE